MIILVFFNDMLTDRKQNSGYLTLKINIASVDGNFQNKILTEIEAKL